MKYRVVQKDDGLFYMQYHDWLWFWADSTMGPFSELDHAIEVAKRFTRRNNPPRVVKVIYP